MFFGSSWRVSEHASRKPGEIRAGWRRRGEGAGPGAPAARAGRVTWWRRRTRRARQARLSGALCRALPGASGLAGPGQPFSTSWVPTTQRSCALQPGARVPRELRPQALSQSSPLNPRASSQTHKSALRGEVLYCLLSFSRQRDACRGDPCSLRMMKTKYFLQLSVSIECASRASLHGPARGGI